MNSLKMVLRNISNYGIYNLLIMILYEAFYCINKKYRSHVFYDESVTSKYDDIKDKHGIKKQNVANYNAPYSPTPIYFLNLIRGFIKKINTKEYVFLDLGCGAGRTLTFFKKDFKLLVGIDFNKYYQKFIKDGNYLNLNLRDPKSVDKIKNQFPNDKYTLYLYEPFDQKLVKNIIKKFLNKRLLIVIVNVEEIKLNELTLIYCKTFNNPVKNIRIYSNS